MSRLTTLALLALVAVLLVLVIVVLALDMIVREGLERVASAHAKVPVTMQRVRISPFAGRAVLDGVAIANPPTYQAPAAVTVELVTAQIDWGTLTTDRVMFREVVIVRPDISFEGSLSENNLETLRRNFATSAKASGPSTGPSPQGSPRVIIQRLRIVDARVNVRLRTGTTETTLKGLRLKDLTLEHLGDPDQPLSTADLTAQVFDALTEEAVGAIGNAAGGLLGKGAEEAGKTVERAVQGLKQLFSK